MATLNREGLRKRLDNASDAAVRGRQAVTGVIDGRTLLRILLALMLALGLWVYVTMRNNPEISRPLLSRSLAVRNLGEGLVLMTDLPRVDMTIVGPSSLVETPMEPVMAYVDFQKFGPGLAQRMPVEVDLPPGVRGVSINPAEVIVDIEALEQAEFQVEWLVTATMPAGVRMNQPLFEPSSVTVVAPTSTLAEISRIVVRPELSGSAAELIQSLRPIPLDRANREIVARNLTITPGTISVTLPALVLTGIKTVPVRSIIEGQPAQGYQLDSIQTSPSVVTVEGEAHLLENLTALETERVSISNRQQPLSQRARLRIPPGITADATEVQIDVGISAVQSRLRLSLVVVPRGLGPGLRFQATPSNVEVVLEGPAPRIQQTDVGALRAEVNLQGVGPGTHVLRPTIAGPGLDGVRVTTTQPEVVTIQITAGPTPTLPVPTAAPTPAAPTPGATSGR